MISLLNTDVVVADRSHGHRIYVVRIVETIMVIIVTYCGNQTSYLVQMIKFSDFNQSSLSVHQEEHLHYICTMQIIVVRYILSIAALNFI